MLGFRVTVKYNLPSGEERRVTIGIQSAYDESEARTQALEAVKSLRANKGDVLSNVTVALVEVL